MENYYSFYWGEAEGLGSQQNQGQLRRPLPTSATATAMPITPSFNVTDELVNLQVTAHLNRKYLEDIKKHILTRECAVQNPFAGGNIKQGRKKENRESASRQERKNKGIKINQN